MSQPAAQQQYASLGAVNQRLQFLQLPAINQQQAQQIQQQIPRDRFIDALANADVNDVSRKMLSQTINRVVSGGQQPANSDNHSQQGAPMNRQSPAHAQQHEQQPTQASASQNDDKFLSHHVYGGKGALCFNIDETKNHAFPTIRLEGAPAAQPRVYTWANKIAVQFTREELLEVACVFLGLTAKVEGKNHGMGDEKKGFEIEHQGDKLFARVYGAGKGAVSVPIGPADTFAVASIIIRQIQKSQPWLGTEDVIMLLRSTVGRMKQA